MTNKTEEIIDTFGIKNKNTISYIYNDIKHKIIITKESIILIRENNDFNHELIFKLNTMTKTEYYIKEYNTSIDIYIKTTKINTSDYKIEINYEIEDTRDNYLYILEMSEKI